MKKTNANNILKPKKLMVIINDNLSNIINKGEVIDRYYNPGNLFSEVHLILTNNDKPNIEPVQRMVGEAKLHLYNIMDDKVLFFLSFGWNTTLLKLFMQKPFKIAREVKPHLIRCHSAAVNIYVSYYLKKKMQIPYVVSLHINPDVDIRKSSNSLLKKMVLSFRKKIERIGLLNADFVMPVYSPIVPYLKNLGVLKYEVCYNVINPIHLRKKNNYDINRKVKVISVGRQFLEKNPINLIKAAARINNLELTMIGDGPYHRYLINAAHTLGIADRIIFHKSIPNDQLCAMLPKFDIFATHSEYWEISKSVLEPLLSGLPVILNKRKGDQVKELFENNLCVFVPNTMNGYYRALKKLINNKKLRKDLGRSAYVYSQSVWSPKITEMKFVNIYNDILKKI